MILQMLEPGSGGVLTHVAELTEHLLHRGNATAVAFSSCRKDEGLESFSDLLRQFSVPAIDMRVTNRPSPWDTVAFSRILAFCRRYRPRLIHCHSAKAGVLGRCLAKLLRIPAVYTPHAYLGLRPQSTMSTRFATFAERALGHAALTVATNRQELDFATSSLGLTKDRVIKIHNGVNFAKFCPTDEHEKQRLRLRQSLPADSFVVAAICRLEYQKDPVSLIHGFAQAHRECPKLHLSLVGRGALAGEVHNAVEQLGIASAITWAEYHGQPNEIYKAADAFVSTARYEGLPLVVLEALASNLPLVLSDCSGHTEFCGHGLNKLELVPQENPNEVAEGILKIYGRRNEFTNHRAVGRPLFSREHALASTVSLYDRLLCEQGGLN